MKRIGQFLGIVAVLNLVAMAGGAMFLAATGRLDSAKARTVADLLRHKGTPDDLRQKVGDLLEAVPATASAPATMASSQPADLATAFAATAEDRLTIARQAMEQERLRLDAQAQELQHRQELLDRQQALFAEKVASLEQDKKTFEAKAASADTVTKDARFKETMELYDQLKPAQVKDLMKALPIDLTAEFIKSMDAERAGKIIAQFEAVDEKAYIGKVLEQIRTGGTGNATAMAAATRPAGS